MSALGQLIVPLIVVVSCLSQAYVDATDPSTIKVIVSDSSGLRLQQVDDIPWKPKSERNVKSNEAAINLDTSTKFQTYDGMGGSFMRAGATLLNQMPNDVQDDITTFEPLNFIFNNKSNCFGSRSAQ